MPTRLHTLSVLMASLLLSACGDAPKPEDAPSIPQFVVLSAQDCAQTAAIALTECSEAIDRAVATHEANSKSYRRQKLCEDDEGPDRCERLEDSSWRPKPMAYVVVAAKPPQATVLYAGKDKALVYRTAGNTIFDPEKVGDKSVAYQFSRAALRRVENFATTN